MKQRFFLASISGGITTGLVSLIALIFNIGFVDRFLLIWLKTWAMGCLVSIPSVIFIVPVIDKLVNHYFRK